MFLNEVVLGKEHHITRDDHTLTSAPPGFHCVIAKGRTEPGTKTTKNFYPTKNTRCTIAHSLYQSIQRLSTHCVADPTNDITIDLDGKTVHVPQGKPVSMSQYSGSSFSQSEYLVYKESQARIRYLLKLKF